MTGKRGAALFARVPRPALLAFSHALAADVTPSSRSYARLFSPAVIWALGCESEREGEGDGGQAGLLLLHVVDLTGEDEAVEMASTSSRQPRTRSRKR